MESVDRTEENLNFECPAISENSACPCYKFEEGELSFASLNASRRHSSDYGMFIKYDTRIYGSGVYDDGKEYSAFHNKC